MVDKYMYVLNMLSSKNKGINIFIIIIYLFVLNIFLAVTAFFLLNKHCAACKMFYCVWSGTFFSWE